jgi:hypothetical protein
MSFLKELSALFLLIVVITTVKPSIINDLYSNILGRIVLIAIILFFTIHNTTLGLLVALCLIVASNQFFGANKIRIEGFTDPTTDPTTDPNTDPTTDPTTDPNEKEEEKEEDGVDRLTVQESNQPVDSNAIPVSKENFSSTEVAASSTPEKKQGFALMYSEI